MKTVQLNEVVHGKEHLTEWVVDKAATNKISEEKAIKQIKRAEEQNGPLAKSEGLYGKGI